MGGGLEYGLWISGWEVDQSMGCGLVEGWVDEMLVYGSINQITFPHVTK